MKKLQHIISLSLTLFFTAAMLHAQQGVGIDTLEAATALHEEGKALLQKEPQKAFDKIRALGKFLESGHFLHLNLDEKTALLNENETQVQLLTDFFSSISNRDSLLNLTRFYPDSVFQANQQYSEPYRAQLTELLAVKKRKTRSDFFKIDGLKRKYQTPASGSSIYVLDFEDYWPLEVIETEQELQVKEHEFKTFSKKTQAGLLYAHVKNELDALKHSITKDSLSRILQRTQLQKEKAELEVQESRKQYLQLQYIGLCLGVLLLIIGLYAKRKSSQLLTNMNQNLLEEKKRSEELLLNILPAEVAKELKNQASARAHKYNNVSVLFSDFQSFSQIARLLEPEELVTELDYCFTAFDRIIDKYRLQKIKTIGDAYMCVGGMYTKGNDHNKRMILAALEIQQFLEHLKERRKARGRYFFEARIGVHTGPIVAGVVGSKKFAFDIWGDTVNVAQQMEFHSEAGKVNISGTTYELVKDQFKFTSRGKAVVKNMKAFDMYFVDEYIRKKH